MAEQNELNSGASAFLGEGLSSAPCVGDLLLSWFLCGFRGSHSRWLCSSMHWKARVHFLVRISPGYFYSPLTFLLGIVFGSFASCPVPVQMLISCCVLFQLRVSNGSVSWAVLICSGFYEGVREAKLLLPATLGTVLMHI